MPVWLAYAGGSPERRTGTPNMPMQVTPLRVRKIVAFLKVRIGPKLYRSIGGGATDGQAVGRTPVLNTI